MRPHWMTEDDYDILEYLVESGLTLTPKGLAYNLDGIGYFKAASRLQHLREHGMAEFPEPIQGVKPTGIYRASELGRRFIAGDITVKQLREAEPSDG